MALPLGIEISFPVHVYVCIIRCMSLDDDHSDTHVHGYNINMTTCMHGIFIALVCVHIYDLVWSVHTL